MAKKKQSPSGDSKLIVGLPLNISGPKGLPKPESVSVGLKGSVPEASTGGPLVSASSAGASSPLFPKGGDAFAAFCHSKGININLKRKADEWKQLLTEFADQPIFGCRRGPNGGDHRPSPESLG